MSELYHPVQLPLFVFSKVCPSCHIEKSLDDFHKTWRTKDGHHSRCKACRSRDGKAYHAATIEKQHARSRRYYESHKEQTAVRTKRRYQAKYAEVYATRQKWVKAHPENVKAYNKKFREKPERKAYVIAYRAAHPELHRAYVQRYRSKPEARERQKAYMRATRLQNAERRRRREARKVGTHTTRISYERILREHGYWCYICEHPIERNATERARKLTFDHVIPLLPRPGEPQGTHTEDNLRPAHMTCNVRKGNKPFESLTPFDRRGP